MNATSSARASIFLSLFRSSLWLLAILVSTVTLAHQPHAQQQNLNPETLGALIQGLQQLDRQGTFPGIGGAGATLDRIRERAQSDAAERAEQAPSNEVGLGEVETIIARAYCNGTITENDRVLLETMENFSRLERDYCVRAGELIQQVGYGIFEGKFVPEALINGAAPSDFRLGIGDTLVVTFVGQESSTAEVTVDREGRVSLRQLPPIPAAGLTMREFRRELEARADSAFIGTETFVSLGEVRSMSILVAGEVVRPGLQRATALATVIDVLGLAGGVKKTGSLRRIEIHRGDEVLWLDLYDLVLGRGTTQDLTLSEGDRIVVPPIGPTVAVAGEVKRPGIFELSEDNPQLDFEDVARFTGGTIRPRGFQLRRHSFDEGGLERIDVMTPEQLLAGDGDLIVVRRRVDNQVGGVELAGHVRVPGVRSIQGAPTVASLIGGYDSLKNDPYLLFGVLETTDPATRARRLFPLNLQNVMMGQEDYSLRDGDRLIVLGREDVRYLSSREVQDVISVRRSEGLELPEEEPEEMQGQQRAPQTAEPATLGTLEQIAASLGQGNALAQGSTEETQQKPSQRQPALVNFRRCEALRSLEKLVLESRPGRFSNAIVGSEDSRRKAPSANVECNDLYEENPGLLIFVLEHGAAINGEVRAPGIYPVVQGARVSSIVGVAGGLTREADTSRIQVSRFRNESEAGLVRTDREELNAEAQGLDSIEIGPGDVVRFNPVFTDRDAGPVFLVGEFLRPGPYEIRRGERLSQLIARAGGLTAQAYPYGAVFTRERVRRAEEASLRRLARELNAAVTVAAANRGINAGAISSFAALTREIATAPASGRVVIEADPTVLQVRPELDIVLEPGDRFFMPKRPNSVLVTGDVLNPGAMQFVSGKSIDTYVRQAGGFQQTADRGRLFVVFPDGSAQPVSVSPFNYTPVRVPPGSAIVVPKDATPFDLFTITREVSSVLSQLALTAASLAVISDN